MSDNEIHERLLGLLERRCNARSQSKVPRSVKSNRLLRLRGRKQETTI